MRTKKLGPVQQGVLDSVRLIGFWGRGCGWVWDFPARTRRVCEVLVKKGHLRYDSEAERFYPVEDNRQGG